MTRILIVGGAGFIGSHTCLTLLNSDHELIILDNFSNSSPIALNRVSKIANNSKLKIKKMEVIKGDVRDLNLLNKIFRKYLSKNKPIEAVIHFAGLKSVKESLIKPDLYWDINVNGTKTLLKAMEGNHCKVLVFSSSATIYGSSQKIPIPETEKINPLNPYGKSKAEVERILSDIAGCTSKTNIKEASPNGWKIARLRYFNPVGAHISGMIGEDPKDIPNNLFPYITQVAFGIRKELHIFGNNWPTKDGTGVRDYIHVMDLAEGHSSALEHLLISNPQLITLNLGTGKGTSVMEALKKFEEISSKKINYKIVERRQGDSAIAIADIKMAKKYLNWESKRDLEAMCRDCWRWQESNPNGYVL